MRWVRSAALVGMVVMAAAIVWGITAGGIVDDFSTVWAIPWGRVGLVDLFVGLALVIAIVIWRERDPRRWIPWTIGIVVLGNLATAAYVLWALRDPRGERAP
jgi:hypothetical protein